MSMELTHVPVQGTNAGPPPRPPKNVTLPLNQLWNQGIDPSLRRQVLRLLSHAAARSILGVEAPLTKPLEPREVSDE
jgi:hypothetical protein